MKYSTEPNRRELREHKWRVGGDKSVCTRCGRETSGPCWTGSHDCAGKPGARPLELHHQPGLRVNPV